MNFKKFILKSLSLIFFIFIISCSENNSNDQKFIKGEKIYNNFCKSCHMDGGKGHNLFSKNYEITDILNAVSNGIGSMPSFKELLSEEDIDAVAYFILKK